MMSFKATQQLIELHAEIDSEENLPLISQIYGDENRFSQILSNFLSNALKFTDPDGRITVSISIKDEQTILKKNNNDASQILQIEEEKFQENWEEKYIKLQLEVIDTGVGMTQEGIDNLFIDFGRLKENEYRNRSGTGLGLSIIKQIIEKMGGSVSVTSTKNVGSRFKICLNTKCRLPKQEANEIRDGLKKKHPFVVKDSKNEMINTLLLNDNQEKS